MNNVNLPSRLRIEDTRRALLLVVGFALLSSACAGTRVVPHTDWLPDSAGWTVRDVDDDEPPRWVIYERDAEAADVKAIRVVGVVDAEPEAVARALRDRLLDDDSLPEGVERKILRESKTVVEHYARSPMPFPFDDREVYERLRFGQDPTTGVYTVDADSFDPGTPIASGVERIPLVQNRMVIAPAGPGQSAVTMDSVHDMGGHFPNWLIYGPVGDYLVEELAVLNERTAEPEHASR